MTCDEGEVWHGDGWSGHALVPGRIRICRSKADSVEEIRVALSFRWLRMSWPVEAIVMNEPMIEMVLEVTRGFLQT